jgi:hypothetical protein
MRSSAWIMALALAATGCSTEPSPADNAPPADPGGSCAGSAGESFAAGAIAKNWELKDHLGQPVQLYDHCGKVVFFEEGAQW